MNTKEICVIIVFVATIFCLSYAYNNWNLKMDRGTITIGHYDGDDYSLGQMCKNNAHNKITIDGKDACGGFKP